MNIYENEGLSVTVDDDEAVTIYVEGVMRIEMTLDEFRAITQEFNTSPYAR